ncbi:hypothetical protein BCR44DRAFT_1430614 [Catenaria anguillulae PL171]|uniref:Uncharacterized protein n=1 Tax=Catenaria anguillulae PL171 TaxID=765915 RepID=A0A1Y2HSR6_9FUNG|nr:hypothetical protein BCR44DRAFT_1430614 [Catenaria anguillulae PL171]
MLIYARYTEVVFIKGPKQTFDGGGEREAVTLGHDCLTLGMIPQRTGAPSQAGEWADGVGRG